ncbi:hypothetical protein WN73_06530 [Bradyrhizobium sp. CCBAU 45394]|jgi:hypothetical protein|nr:hypothetical protein [Bradyrhizobium sp. CCBAU 45394]
MLLCGLPACAFAQQTAGASRHPAFPAPSWLKRRELKQSSGETRRENGKACLLLKMLKLMIQTKLYDRHPEVRALRRNRAAEQASKGDGPAASSAVHPSRLRSRCFASQASRLRMTELLASSLRVGISAEDLTRTG